MTALSNGNSYAYDANGNMTYRYVYDNDKLTWNTFNLTYDAENRLAQVSGAVTETFKYNGDGQRIVATQGVTTTVYIGNYFEWHGTPADMVKYYYSGATRVAMRVGATPTVFLMGDHLGSTSVAVNEQGAPVGGSPQLYKAWGETRSGSLPTKYQYTGQFKDSYIKLYWYNSRWYDGTLGRFIQADSIIPNAYNSQAFDRYAYGLNNPSRFTDPTGHSYDCAIGEFGCEVGVLNDKGLWKLYNDEYHLDQDPKRWTPGQKHGFALLINELRQYYSYEGEKSGQIVTEGQKLGKAITAFLVTIICNAIEYGLFKGQVAGLKAGVPGWILDAVILIPEFAIADFEVSFNWMIYQETGYDAHEVDFEWILSNWVADQLPESLHDDLIVILPTVFH